MMGAVPLEVWLGVQFLLTLVMIGLFVLIFKRVKSSAGSASTSADRLGDESRIMKAEAEAMEKADKIIAMLEPLVRDAEKAADQFEQQIREKKHLAARLNDTLDSRIISLNLLLARAEALLNYPLPDRGSAASAISQGQTDRGFHPNVIDQQQQILDLHNQGQEIETIARSLSIPKGEVRLVISLKQKCLEMGNPK